MSKRFLVLVSLCASALAAHASLPERVRIPPPVRMALADSKLAPITLDAVSIRTDISGGMAETTVKMVFFNPNSRRLEGNLQFPLAPGQQVTAFALDINGAMRTAVPVAKDKGRQVFEAIERRQVDPGLLEVTQGNNFKLRVYPILPRATRTVELTYAEPMTRRASQWVYRLPMGYGKAGSFDWEVVVNGASVAPTVNSVGTGLVFEPVPKNNAYQASLNRKNFTAPDQFEVLTSVQADATTYRQEIDGQTWFLAEVPVPVTRSRRTAPRVIGLLWDSSGSGSTRSVSAELGELDAYFRALGDVEVRLTRLRDRAEKLERFDVINGNWSALRRALEATDFDGASALNDWQPESRVDQYLLFSDGLSNYGGKRFPVLDKRQTLFALNSSPSANAARLAALAERSGGRYLDVSAGAPGAAAQALLFSETQVVELTTAGAAEVEMASRTATDGMLRLAGRFLSSRASVTLTLADGANRLTKTIPIAADAPLHPRAGAAWAGYRLRTLEGDYEMHLAEIGRIGRRFGIPTRETSLIVLEEMNDYVRYEIEPPAQLADEYKRRLATQRRIQGEARKDHFARVLSAFDERKQWWAQSFTVRKKRKAQLVEESTAMAISPSPVADVAPTLAYAPPSPPAMEKGIEPFASNAVTVTGSTMRRRFAPVSANAAPEFKRAQPAQRGIGIELKKWQANAPYIDRLKRAESRDVYRVYLDLKADYANSSAFYLDAADILFDKGQRDLALRVLSNLSEMDLENRSVLRILGYRLLQAKAPELAIGVFEDVLRIAVEEPQSFRDLGLALAAAGRHQEAIDRLYEVVVRPWDDRFADVEVIVLAEINALLATSKQKLDTSRIDRRLRAHQPLDVRVVLTWDADNSDMDLFVTDPYGDKTYFAEPMSRQGGKMSNDFTGGYGPEEFALRKAAAGKYKIEVNYFGNHQQVIAGATTLQVTLVTHFGLPQQQEQLISLRLKDQAETVFVGEFDVK